LIVGSDGGMGSGIQVLTKGGEPYNGMQRAYGAFWYVHMELDPCCAKKIGSSKSLHSSATPAQN
jgi:hypothetical protein